MTEVITTDARERKSVQKQMSYTLDTHEGEKKKRPLSVLAGPVARNSNGKAFVGEAALQRRMEKIVTN